MVRAMLQPRLAWIPLLALLAAVPAQAQDAPPAEDTDAPASRRATPRPPAPIMVAVLPAGRVPDPVVEAAQTAMVDAVTAMASGRPVHALVAPELRQTLAGCGDDACIGALLAQAGAQAGVIVRIGPRPRRPYQATIEMRDPVSGTARQTVEGELPLDAAAVGPAARALAEQLRDAMPSPPPRPATLTVTVNVDGARVSVDGEEIGVSPVAPIDVVEGPHEIAVLMPGYLSARRQVRVSSGEQARVDINLTPSGVAAATEPGGTAPAAGGDVTGEWWFWTAIGVGAAVLAGIAIGIGVAASSGGQGMQDPRGILLPPIVGGM
jgi:hypothetical protein